MGCKCYKKKRNQYSTTYIYCLNIWEIVSALGQMLTKSWDYEMLVQGTKIK